jgi:serine/threonine-protein kinase RIO1
MIPFQVILFAIDIKEMGHRQTVQFILENGLATGVRTLLSSGKEANVNLVEYKGSPVWVKVYRRYQTSHREGRPVRLDSNGWLAAHEWDMLYQTWKGGASVPTQARPVMNMVSICNLGDERGPALRMQDAVL